MFIVSPSFALSPDKLVLFNRFDRMTSDLTHPGWVETFTPKIKLERSFHNFAISDNAFRNLRQKVNWLYYLSKKKDIKTYSGRRIFSFRCAFITFTLPSKQKTPTVDITKRLFNHLLTVLREKYAMSNYVWRLEFQKNGNVHYHLVTDTYIDYFAVQKVWNSVLETDGYVSDFAKKHNAMSLHDYVQAHSKGDKSKFEVLKKRYFKGKSENWQKPPSVDVKSVISKDKIASYVSKYFSKSPEGCTICNEYDTPENSKTMRLWFCSRGLSRLKTISDYLAHVNFCPETLIRACKGFRRVRVDYAVLYFFDISKILGSSRRLLAELFRNYANEQNYVPN